MGRELEKVVSFIFLIVFLLNHGDNLQIALLFVLHLFIYN